ncbi:MAG: class I SAM-dependent methyltransferase [Deltaproteobacteria bacterium]|nr:class I SAM-dependent methyltransferase [Deltaproteobacteria bacterium]
MENLNPDWWKTLFDETYMITDARSVCDDELSRREVDFLEGVLNIEKSDPVLDLCGGHGRHSLELSRRGFKNVTVLDYSEVLINVGRERARQEGLATLFIQGDARDTGLPDERFQKIIIMASSFGYFVDQSENEKILREGFRLLMPGGSILLDLPDKEYVLKNSAPQAWHEANEETVICRQRTLDGNVIYSREMVISKENGLIRDETYCTRLYGREEIITLLMSAGFPSVNIQKNFVSHDKEGDYGCLTNRMIVIAEKGY